MNLSYPIFKEALAPFLCFSLQDARKHFPDFDRKRLTEWQKKGYIQKVVKGYYIFSELTKDTRLWWYVANRIFDPSYISLQSALNYYGFIPEAVFQVSCITTKRTRNLGGSSMHFVYRNIKNSCYFGFTLVPLSGDHFIRLAEPEKALLDLLYLETSIENDEDFEAWRFNKPVILETIDTLLMEQYAILMQNLSCYNRFTKFNIWLHA